jgi:hypothetical protein
VPDKLQSAVAGLALCVVVTLLAACAGGGGGASVNAGVPAPPPPAVATADNTSSNGCPASSSDLGGLIYCQAAGVAQRWQECGCALGSWTIDNPNPFSYVSWGPWSASGITAPPTGERTPPEAMPKTGSAKYVGDAYGIAWGGTPEKGTVTIGVSFEAPAGVTVDIDLPSHNLPTATGQVWGSSYAAHGGFQIEFNTDTIDIVGAFYGPDASETAGTFSYKKSSFDNMTGRTKELESVSGSFGAKLCGAMASGC